VLSNDFMPSRNPADQMARNEPLHVVTTSESSQSGSSRSESAIRATRPAYAPEEQARDVELMARVVNGDREALGTLYDLHAPRMLAVVQGILRDRRLAEEATHDVFLNLWQHPRAYEPQRGAFGGWLLRVARNRSIDLLRRQRERRFADLATGEDGSPIDPAAWLPDPDPDPADQAVTADLGARVRSALAQLSPEQRSALELAYFGGLSHSEIAERLGRPLGTVKTQIRTGMQRLAVTLAGLDPSKIAEQ
jgi:RNA polymerase sigma-70 factor (ECF subfamily)